jgi:hypothetical protein
MSTQTRDASAPNKAVTCTVGLAPAARLDGAKPRIELWSPWGGWGRPCTAREEAAFVARLRELAFDDPEHDASTAAVYQRRHITALMTGLRNSVTADDLLAKAPGLRPNVLLAAYDDVEAARLEAANAWQVFAADPSADALEDIGPIAAGLLPVVISQLRALRFRRAGDAPALARVVARIAQEIQLTHVRALELEALMQTLPSDDEAAARVSELLYDGCGDGIWSFGTFLAPRVGTLIPSRLASLLGEEGVTASRARPRQRLFDAVA